MLNAKQMAAVAASVAQLPAETYGAIKLFLEDAARDASENTTSPGEQHRDWYAGHERAYQDAVADLEALRTGRWKEWAGYEDAGEEADEPEGVEIVEAKPKRGKTSPKGDAAEE